MTASGTTRGDRHALSVAMNLSLAVGFVMLGLKVGAFWLTGSAAILSDAAESVVHVAAVSFAAFSLRLSRKPADASHLYGHAKIAFFSAGFEGAMIMVAGCYIIYESLYKWIAGLQLTNLGWGTALTAAAALVNGALGGYLIWLGRRNRSLILEANGKHVLTDCWTSIAVLVGLGLVLLTGWLPWDPLCGIAMAANILLSGGRLIGSAVGGLMDVADPQIQKELREILDRETARYSIRYHNLRHRNVGDALWIEVHLLFPGRVSLGKAHRQATDIEQAIGRKLDPRTYVITHLESLSDHDAVHPGEQHTEPDA